MPNWRSRSFTADDENMARRGEYKIKHGDTLWSISKQTGIPVEQLKQLNGITDPKQMKAGRTLNLGDPQGGMMRKPGYEPRPNPYLPQQQQQPTSLAELDNLGGGASCEGGSCNPLDMMKKMSPFNMHPANMMLKGMGADNTFLPPPMNAMTSLFGKGASGLNDLMARGPAMSAGAPGPNPYAATQQNMGAALAGPPAAGMAGAAGAGMMNPMQAMMSMPSRFMQMMQRGGGQLPRMPDEQIGAALGRGAPQAPMPPAATTIQRNPARAWGSENNMTLDQLYRMYGR